MKSNYYNVIILIIVIICTSIFTCGCENRLTHYFDIVNLDALDTRFERSEDYFDDPFYNYYYGKFYYSAKNIERYKDKDYYAKVSAETFSYVINMISSFENGLEKYAAKYPEEYAKLKNNYDFNIETDVKEGDLFYCKLDLDFSSSVLPENSEYRRMEFDYVSFSKNIVYSFKYSGTSFYLLSSSENISTIRRDFEDIYPGANSLIDDFENGKYKIGRPGIHPEAEEQFFPNDYYYKLRDTDLIIQSVISEDRNLGVSYIQRDDDFATERAGIAFLRGEQKNWSREDFFFHYSWLFTCNEKSYFTYSGIKFLKIKTGRFVYYFFMQDGDYIVECWDTFNQKEPENEELIVEKVILIDVTNNSIT